MLKLKSTPMLHTNKSLEVVQDELRFVLITSYASVFDEAKRPEDAVASEIEGLWIKVCAFFAHAKCVRCWHHREEVGESF